MRRVTRSGELLSDGFVLLETVRLIEDALRSGVRIAKVFMRHGAEERVTGLLRMLALETEVYELTAPVFDSVTTTESSQGILALAAAPEWQEKDLFGGNSTLVLVVAGLQDPGNIGTVIRTAEAFHATGLILTEGTVSPFNAKAVRATAGSLFRLPLLRNVHVSEIPGMLARRGIPLFVSTVSGADEIGSMHFSGPVAIAIGSEGAGVPEQLVTAGGKFTIPIARTVESLNVAAATAVMLYEVARQRAASEPRPKGAVAGP
ncbi:MAG: RNA methyltransferase [Acidobacteria bacterium]|nr:RNA methyltransferase [Acidobacteriota bacterium]